MSVSAHDCRMISSTSLLKCSQSMPPSAVGEIAVKTARAAVNDLPHTRSFDILNANLETILNRPFINCQSVGRSIIRRQIPMSPRPQKVTDDDIFMATHRAMSRLGPGELTLAEIASEAGVTAGLLVQRFGSKRDLLLALSRAVFRRHRRDVRRSAPRPPLAAGDAPGLQRLHGAHGRRARRRSRATSPTCRSTSPIPTSASTWRGMRRATRVELQKLIKEAIDAKELVAGHQSETTGPHDRGGDRRLDAELGLLSGRRCRKVDAS